MSDGKNEWAEMQVQLGQSILKNIFKSIDQMDGSMD